MDRIYKELCVERNHKAGVAGESSVRGRRMSRTWVDGERCGQNDLRMSALRKIDLALGYSPN